MRVEHKWHLILSLLLSKKHLQRYNFYNPRLALMAGTLASAFMCAYRTRDVHAKELHLP